MEKKIDIKPLVKHVLSKELQLYYEKIVQAVLHRDHELRDSALESVREDNGIQQILPYFIQFITDQVCDWFPRLGGAHRLVDYQEYEEPASAQCDGSLYRRHSKQSQLLCGALCNYPLVLCRLTSLSSIK